jgi:hypothetical protein
MVLYENGTKTQKPCYQPECMKPGGLEMNGCWWFALCGIGLASLAACRSSAAPPRQSEGALTSDRLQVYADFIESFSKTNFKFLSNRTFPLDLSGVDKDTACLQGLELEGTEEERKAVHLLGPEVLRGKAIRRVGAQEEGPILEQRDSETTMRGTGPGKDTSAAADPGILALSEIVFDKRHHFAVLKYVFLCGSRCNSGAILALEKVGPQWTGTTRRPCSFVLNQDNPRL